MKLSPQFHCQWPSVILSLALDTVFATAAHPTSGHLHSENTTRDLADNKDDHEDNDNAGRSVAATSLMQDVSDFLMARPGTGESLLVHVLQQMWGGLTDAARDSLVFAFANALLQAQFSHPHRVSYTTTTDMFRTRSAPAVFLSLFARLVPLPRFPVEFLSCLGSQCGCDAELQGLLEALITTSAATQPTSLVAKSEGGITSMHHNVGTNSSSSGSATELMMLRTASLALYDRIGDADLLRGGLRAR